MPCLCRLCASKTRLQRKSRRRRAFGLSAALYEKIGFAQGKVLESNFHDYRLLRMDRMPQVEVHLIASGEAPGGVGEIAVPSVAPAVCNALFALTGRRIRSLPIALLPCSGQD